MSVKPDLSCNIEAVGPEGKSIDDGSAVSYPRPDAGLRFIFVVTNATEVRSGPFWLRPSVRVNGDKVYDPEVEMINLEPGETWTHEVAHPLGGEPEDWKASILVDINDFVDEADERNNRCELAFTALPPTAG